MTKIPSPEDAAIAAPPSQQLRTAPPGNLAQEHRTGPRSGHSQDSRLRNSLSRIGAAYPLPQPVLRCKRRSQLPQNRTPVRPHVLHTLPYRYAEGDTNAIVGGTSPPTGDTLRTTEQTPGQDQGRCLMDREPVMLHELHPAYHRTIGRVDLMYFHSLAITTGEEVCLDLAAGKRRQQHLSATALRSPSPYLQGSE